MNDLKMVWCDESGQGRNVFCLFLRCFRVDTVPASVPLHLFADSLYRLRVNGEVVGFGPARFLPAWPEYDSYDLARFLRVGANTVLVEVHSRGVACFQAVASRGGFVAAGRTRLAGGSELDFATPGDWRVCRPEAWDRDTENFSFAQGPIEVVDGSRQPPGYPAFPDGASVADGWHRPVMAGRPEHWGTLLPRSIPMPSLDRLIPQKIVLAAPVEEGRSRHGFNAENHRNGERQPFFTHIYSATDQEIDLGVFWGPVFVNGRELAHVNCAQLGNRQVARVALHAGWNFVYGLPAMLRACWTWLMDLPDASGLLLRALPAANCEHAFGLGAPLWIPGNETFPPAPSFLDELPGDPATWKYAPAGLNHCSPARELAWDSPEEIWQQDRPYHRGLELPVTGESATVVLDFGREYIGHLRVEFETENGTILDAGYDERLKENGVPAYYLCNPFVNSADRCRVGAGRHRFDGFHERGGRYLQLMFRGRPGRVRIHRVEILQKTADTRTVGDFRCDDALYNWVWQTGIETVRACTTDGWTDCPWRERGMYIGDVLVAALATRKFAGDWRMESWAIRLWARAQLPDGQLPDVVPSERTALSDYTLIWVILLRNYWSATGDVGLVREVWDNVGRVFGCAVWKAGLGGLWETHPECVLFVDWGAAPDEKRGVNGVLNAFRFRALQCAAELAEAIGLQDEAQAYAAEAETVQTAFHDVLWDDLRQRFAACWIDGRLSDAPSSHVNTLVLAYGLAHGSRQAGVLAYLRQEIRHNARCQEGHLELYFLTFLLQGLYRVGESGLAEAVIRDHYSLMQERGAWTFWETLKNGLAERDSLCHAWSAGPLIFFSERVLGVREEIPGDPTRMLVAPESASLNEASGAVPHPRGTIQISWRIEQNKLLLALTLPDGVKARVEPAGRLADLELVRVPFDAVISDKARVSSAPETQESPLAGIGS